MKQIIEKVALGALLLLAVIVGPALSTDNRTNQTAAVARAGAGTDYSILNNLNRDQLVDVIKCLTDGSGIGLQKCVARVTANAPATSTTSQLIASSPGSPLRSSNFRVNSIDVLANVPLLNFNVRSDTGASQIQSLTVTASGTKPATLYLYDGATLLKSKSVPANGIVVFDSLYDIIPRDVVKTIMVKGDFAANTPDNSASVAALTGGTYAQPNGTVSNILMGGPIIGPGQHIFKRAAVIKLAGTPTIASQGVNPNGTTVSLASTFPLTVQALGGYVVSPRPADIVVSFDGIGSYIAVNKSVVVIPNSDIADGSTASVTITASANSSTLPTSGLYNSSLRSFAWNAGYGTTTQTWGFEDFKTSNAAQFNR